jgi:molecular chaperone DnaJ
MSAASKDLYKVLGIAEKASQDEIKKAYRKLAKKYHPDANAGDDAAAERFKEVGEAYSVLSNEEKRSKYDQMQKYGAFDAMGGAPGGGYGGRPPGGGGFPPGGGFSFEDIGGFGDLFGSMFDRGGRKAGGSRRGEVRKGEDIDSSVEISFETAARGGKISLVIPVTEECATCSGTGARPGSTVRSCGECRGSGVVSFGQGGFAVNRPCPACAGRGSIPEVPCPSCRGSGMVRQNRTIQVTVPEGVENGTRLRLSGQGARGGSGGAPGDLLLTFQVKPHPFFRRQGADIHVTVPINLAQAVLGSKVRVRTLDGPPVIVKIPAGTQNGTKLRVRGHGIGKEGKRGDQYVEIKVQVPESVSEEGAEKIREFARVSGLKH